MWHFVGVFPHAHAQCATWRISSCNFIADWTIILGRYISIAGLALATSQFTTTDLPERSHQPEPDFIFPKRSFGKKSVIQGSFQHSWFLSGLFFTTTRYEDTIYCHTCMKTFKEKKNKTSTRADPAFVSSA